MPKLLQKCDQNGDQKKGKLNVAVLRTIGGILDLAPFEASASSRFELKDSYWTQKIPCNVIIVSSEIKLL